MKVIFRADDLGFSEAVNLGIRKAVVDGAITTVGMMPNMDLAKSGYELLVDTGVEIGMHTNMCLGKPLTPVDKIRSLVDENGMFVSSSVIRKRDKDEIVLEEAEMETEAQLSRFIEITGKKPAYLEGHAIMSKNFFQALKNVARKYDLFYSDPVDPEWQKENHMSCAKFYHLDERNLYDPYAYVFKDEAGIKEKECSILVFHPGFIDQYLLDHSSYTLIRPMETAFLCSEELKLWMKENHVEAINFKQARKKENYE
ncbi:ChbG/HpnK family deacetylase [Sharpea azabuensis]|uniref:ChbG/HpnK family deacetylase n=1 Tax=Sharpea azabuensis TaxID=322505 RepID=UPI00240A2600|nr:ChbG/HpnK family deacetylase [Sharpea azabuensis]MDD6511957.1 ChbG/HpnK family deacetylase [Sharpea azabuensis]